MQTITFFLIVGPALLGLYGLALLLNLFGATSSQMHFYQGREDWFPVLRGDQASTHRLVGFVLFVFCALIAVALLKTVP